MPGIVAQSQNTSGASSNAAASFTKPAGQNGDVFYLHFSAFGQVTLTGPSGWTELVNTSTTAGSNDTTMGLWRKVITDYASEPASYSVTWTGNRKWAGNVYVVRGADTTTPEVAGTPVVDNTADTDVELPSVNASTNNSLLIGFVAAQQLWNPSQPANMLGLGWLSSTTGSSACQGAAIQLVDAGATGTRTFTGNDNRTKIGILVAVNPGATPPQAHVVNGGYSITTSDVTTHPVTIPKHVDGDLLVAILAFQTASFANVTAPAGWTLVQGDNNSGATLGAWYRTASSEPATYDWTTAAAEQMNGVVYVIRNAGALDQTGTVTKQTNANVTGASITATGAGVVLLAGSQQGAPLLTATSTAGLFPGMLRFVGGASSAGVEAGYKVIPSGATGNQVIVTNSGNNQLGYLFNFVDASPGQDVPVGQATETELGSPITPLISREILIGQAPEAEAANPITPSIIRTVVLGQASEVETGRTITPVITGPLLVTVGQAAERELAQGITPLIFSVGLVRIECEILSPTAACAILAPTADCEVV